MAALDGDHDPFAAVLPLGGRPGRGHVPVVCVHPMLGLGWTFSSLAARLDGSPTWTVQSLALRDAGFHVDNLDALARSLADATTWACRDAGDDLLVSGVHLVGWSFGGHLAHAMTAAFESQGVEVSSLTLLDPGAPAWAEPGECVTDSDLDVQEVLSFLLAASLRDTPPGLVAPYDPDDVLGFLSEGTGAFAGLDSADLETFVRVLRLNRRLLGTAVQHTVSAPTTLVVSGSSNPVEREAWQQATRSTLIEVPLDIPHDLLTAPYAAERIAPLILHRTQENDR